MIRHILIAAWRNMAANRLISAIAILGLAVGIAAALLIAAVIRNQLSFDHFIPGYERTYLALRAGSPPGLATWYFDRTGHNIAALLKLNAPEIESTTRLILAEPDENKDTSVELKRGEVAAKETIYWADPNVFDVLPLPVYRGDLKTALAQPDGIILPRSIARKYFGHDDVVGEVILVAGNPMVVRAVIQDLPTNATELLSGIFASGLAPFSEIAKLKGAGGVFDLDVNTYLRLKPGASVTGPEQRLTRLIGSMESNDGSHLVHYTMPLLRLDELPLFDGLHPGAKERLIMAGLVGFLVLFIASVNFVNLLTACATHRSPEVGVRKVCGASRRHLILQFLCETIVRAFLAACVAVAFCEWLLPSVNAFLSTGAVLDYWRSPALMVAIVLGIGMLGLAAGTYPAFVLSAFRPASVIKGPISRSAGANAIRNMLVALQFATLIALLIGASVIYQQRVYATGEGLRVDIDQMLLVKGECRPAFRTELRKLPGVAGASCSSGDLIKSDSRADLRYKNQSMLVDIVGTDWGALSLYGIKPVAGSLATHAPYGDYNVSVANSIVINLTAMKRLGITSPQAAIGQYISLDKPLRIAAVVPDFAFYSVQRLIEPTLYRPIISAPPNYTLVSIKLKGQQIPETLASIDRLWNSTGGVGPIRRNFLNRQMEELYSHMTRETEMFAIFSGIAIVLACLGLIGIAISTAERRTKEIGIRKAMGAGTGQIMALLLWQFAQPVLWANVIAWPVAWWLMRRWLSDFAYHVDLHWWVFAAASLGALTIALATVAGQAFLTARQKPVLALRYE